MESLRHWWGEVCARVLRAWWSRRGASVLIVAVACMLGAALWRLGHEFPRLLWDPAGAFDLQLRHHEVHRWFAGFPVYTEVERGDYPPASYAILWPMLGWLTPGPARWLWALTTVMALGWLAWIGVRESMASTQPEMALVALLPFSGYATSATIGVGQLANHVLPLLTAGLLLLRRERANWRGDLGATAVLLPTLVKPTLVAPFYWLVCFVPGRLRPIALVSVGYVLTTLLAIAFQYGSLKTTLFGWLAEPPQVLQGTTNLHKWLALAGLRSWMMPLSVGILVALAVWVARHRRADRWILLGVVALVTRLFIHHRLYDDLLLVLPLITLFRIAKQGPEPDGGDVTAAVLFAFVLASMLAPAQLFSLAQPWPTVMELGQAVAWVGALLFLLRRAQRETPLGTGASAAR